MEVHKDLKKYRLLNGKIRVKFDTQKSANHFGHFGRSQSSLHAEEKDYSTYSGLKLSFTAVFGSAFLPQLVLHPEARPEVRVCLQHPVLHLDMYGIILCCTWTCMDNPVLHLDVYGLQHPVLQLDVYGLHHPVLHLDVYGLHHPVLHLDVYRHGLQHPVRHLDGMDIILCCT